MAEILLTGGTGYIGSHAAVELLEAGRDVVIVDNLYNSEEAVIDRIEKITGRRPAFYNADVSDRASMERVFGEHDISGVMHFAGYKAVGESVEKPLAYYRNNIDTAVTLLELMAEHGVSSMIFSFRQSSVC